LNQLDLSVDKGEECLVGRMGGFQKNLCIEQYNRFGTVNAREVLIGWRAWPFSSIMLTLRSSNDSPKGRKCATVLLITARA